MDSADRIAFKGLAQWAISRGIAKPSSTPTPPIEQVGLDGYKEAFYEIADMLDIPAQTISPREVFETQIKPRILTAVTTDKARDEALEAAAKDFRWRANQCRTNRDAFCPIAASVWDMAADALENKHAR